MVEGLLLAHSLGWVEDQQFADEVCQLGAEVVWDLEVQASDAFCDVMALASFEGCSSAVEFVGQDADCPKVELVVIGSLIDDLRTDVVNSPAEGLPGLGSMNRPPEVRQLDDVVIAKQDVLRLQIAMNDMKLMKVLHRQDHLTGVDGRSLLIEFAFRLQH